jgi:hypothetical protein
LDTTDIFALINHGWTSDAVNVWHSPPRTRVGELIDKRKRNSQKYSRNWHSEQKERGWMRLTARGKWWIRR